VRSFLTAIAEWEAKFAARRTAVVATAMWMTWKTTLFTYDFATLVLAHKGDMVGAAAMAAAMGAPVAGLTGYVFKVYVDSKGTVA
jgi:hypothetical protein